MVGGATHAKFSCLLNVDFAFKRGGVVDSFYYFFLGTKQQLYKKLGEKRWMDFTKSGVPTGKGGGKRQPARDPKNSPIPNFAIFVSLIRLCQEKKLVPRRSGKIVLSKKFCFFIYVNHNPSIVDRWVANFFSFSFSFTLSLTNFS